MSRTFYQRGDLLAPCPRSPTEAAALAVRCKCGRNRAVWRTDDPVTHEWSIHCSKCGERMNEAIMAAVALWENDGDMR